MNHERLNVKRNTQKVARFLLSRLAGGAWSELAHLVKTAELEAPAQPAHIEYYPATRAYQLPEAQPVDNWSDKEWEDFGDGKAA